jgi:two-component system, cell cycle response regulator DivK
MKTRSILLIEDDDATQYIYGTALRHSGFEVLEARTAEHAFELLLDHTPDAIVVDVGLPGLDGFAVLERLRGDPATRRIPTVVVTVHVFPQDEARARAAGCDLFLKKPVTPRVLVGEVQRIIEEYAAASARAS